jgi:enterochelin esterase-like enzyme
MQELVPYIESHFRIIRETYARVLAGGSTGGWESLALQLYHPGFFGGAWTHPADPGFKLDPPHRERDRQACAAGKMIAP